MLTGDAASIKHAISHLRKLPQHLSVMYTGKKEPSVNDVASLVAWSVAANIKFISLCDSSGKIYCDGRVQCSSSIGALKTMSGSLANAIRKHHALYFGSSASQHPIVILTEPSQDHIDQAGGAHVVMILGPETGRTDIVNGVRRLCEDVFARRIESGAIAIESVASKLTVQTPDPELMLVCGPGDALRGVLPWQLRVTEIL